MIKLNGKKCQNPKVLNQGTQIRIKCEVDLHLMKALTIKENLPIRNNNMNKKCMSINRNNSNQLQ